MNSLKKTIQVLLLLVGISCSQPKKEVVSKRELVMIELLSDGQPKLLKTQGSREGDNVHASIQDEKGNLWFGTTGEGLYKFNGEVFEQFTVSDGLMSNNIFCLLADEKGRFWIGTDKGVSLFDGYSFTDIPIAEPIHSTHDKLYIFDILQDHSGLLWFATVEGIFVYDGQTFTPFTVNDNEQGFMSNTSNVEEILEDADGNLWFGGRTNEGVYRYNRKSITHYKLEELNGHDWAWPSLQDSKGNIWFSNWEGVYRYDGREFRSFTENDGLLPGAITRIIEDSQGKLWFGGQSAGICSYDGSTFTHYVANSELINNSTWSLFEDTLGDIWVGTRNTGLYKFDGETFTSYSEKTSEKEPFFTIEE